MIFESTPWRNDLVRDAGVLERWLAKGASERRSIIIEKKVFVGAYAMRRLLQSDKLSSSIVSRNIQLSRFPAIKKIEKNDRWNIHPFFDFKAGKASNLTIPRLLDLIIHSFIFLEWYDELNNETNVVFTSDTKRDQFLWLLPLSKFVKLMRFVANDDPSSMVRWLDPIDNKWNEWRGIGGPPLKKGQNRD